MGGVGRGGEGRGESGLGKVVRDYIEEEEGGEREEEEGDRFLINEMTDFPLKS